MRRANPFLASATALIALIAPLQAQSPAPPADAPAVLQLKVVEGEGNAYATGSRATHGITVLVSDETGKPVEGATVNFKLPGEGPSGSFASGSKIEIVTTRPDGRASAWGMQWNRTAGLLEIQVTAMKAGVRAGIVCPQYLSDSISGPNRSAAGGGSHKWLWIGLIAVAAAGGAVAALVSSKTPNTPEPPAVTIGAPTISLGHP
jgi:hypothetical protein